MFLLRINNYAPIFIPSTDTEENCRNYFFYKKIYKGLKALFLIFEVVKVLFIHQCS